MTKYYNGYVIKDNESNQFEIVSKMELNICRGWIDTINILYYHRDRATGKETHLITYVDVKNLSIHCNTLTTEMSGTLLRQIKYLNLI